MAPKLCLDTVLHPINALKAWAHDNSSNSRSRSRSRKTLFRRSRKSHRTNPPKPTDSKTASNPSNPDCPICYDPITRPTNPVGCTHTFCAACLKTWLDESSGMTCPCCRQDFTMIQEEGGKVLDLTKSGEMKKKIKAAERQRYEMWEAEDIE